MTLNSYARAALTKSICYLMATYTAKYAKQIAQHFGGVVKHARMLTSVKAGPLHAKSMAFKK